MDRKLNLHYAGVHGAYWMIYGVIGSFSSVFLLGRGFSNTEIGIMLALCNVLAVISQPLLADTADRSKRISSYTIMKYGSVLLMLFIAALLVIKSKNLLLASAFVTAFALLHVLQPFCNSIITNLEETGANINFGACRAVGSGTYALLMLFLGSLVELFGSHVIPLSGLVTVAAFFVIIVNTESANKRYTKPAEARQHEEAKEIRLADFVRRHKMFIIMSIGVTGIFFGNAVLNNYLAQITMAVGGGSGDTGRIYSLLAFLEIPTMVVFDRLRKRFTCAAMLKFSSFAFAAWLGACAAARNVTMLLAAQALQPFAFALFLPAIVRFISDSMEKGEAVKGQTLFTTATTGSAIFASIIGGFILDRSSPFVLTVTGTAVTFAGAMIVLFFVDKAEKEAVEQSG